MTRYGSRTNKQKNEIPTSNRSALLRRGKNHSRHVTNAQRLTFEQIRSRATTQRRYLCVSNKRRKTPNVQTTYRYGILQVRENNKPNKTYKSRITNFSNQPET